MDSPRRPRMDAQTVLGLLVALVLCGYGGYRLFMSGGNSPTGAMILCAGLTFVPITIVGLIGGVGLIGVAIWIIARGPVGFDWVIVALSALFGCMAIAERWRRIKR